MTDPQETGDRGCLTIYIGGCRVRARGIVSHSVRCAYMRVRARQIGAEAPNHEIDIPTLATLQKRMKINGISMNDIQFGAVKTCVTRVYWNVQKEYIKTYKMDKMSI